MTVRSVRALGSALVAAAFLAACGGSDDSPMAPGDGGDDRVVLMDPSFATDIQEIILRRGCSASQCHGSGEGGMTLTNSASSNYNAWVGVESTSEPSFLRVEPGDPDNSYVVIKLEGRQSAGARMPLGASPLDDVDLTNIRNWIAAGAQNN
ncbi:MAG: hypothetical protein WD995_14240 [Gemmatimonadota bacterium]